MQSDAATVDEYLAGLPEDRQEALSAVRQVILASLPEGYVELMQYGMIGYAVPHSLYPAGYHCDPRQPLQYAGLGNQKNHMALYLMCVYLNEPMQARFRDAWLATGKKLDMGKACVRFKKLDDVPLEVIGQTIASVPVETYVERVESILRAAKERKAAKK
jgi:hypothetical protein